MSVIQSLNGKSYHVDLCQEILTETGEGELIVENFMTPIGEPPFRSRIVGLPRSFASNVLIITDQKPPYQLTFGIRNTRKWAASGITDFFIETVDKYGYGGNISIHVGRDECKRDKEVEDSFTKMANLNVKLPLAFVRNSFDY